MDPGRPSRSAALRDRRALAALAIATVILGVASTRLRGHDLPYVIAKGVPDALYTVLVYWLFLLIRPALPVRIGTLAAGLATVVVELSQLYQAPWIRGVRATRLGGLVLGHGFHASDLLWYALGALFAALLDRRLFPRASPATKPLSARARQRWIRLRIAAFWLLAPTLWIVLGDVLRRARHLGRFDQEHALGYAASIVESAVFWAVLVLAASRRRGALAVVAAGLFVALFALSSGLQGGFWSIWNIYMGSDAQLAMDSIPAVIVGAMPLSRPTVLIQLGLAIAVGGAIVAAARYFVRPRRALHLVSAALVPAVLFAVAKIPVSYHQFQSTTPDLIYFHGLTAGVKEQLGLSKTMWSTVFVTRRTPEPVPPLTARPARPRNVLLILQEAQRVDVTCVEYDPACALSTRFSNAAAPDRLPLLQMRANATATAIAASNLWSGIAPNEGRSLLLSAPLTWEYARAAGYHTAYWTSQHLMFGNSRLYIQDLPLDRFASATLLDPQAEMFSGASDRELTDHLITDFEKLPEPFFAVVHYSNNHSPRRYDARYAPFQPSTDTRHPSPGNERYKNFYKNVVHLSDRAAGRLIQHVRGTAAGQRTVIVYTADHGESYREHHQAGDHSSSVYDEELLVPTWIDAPRGTLSPEEETSIASAKYELVWHLDLATTLLDLLGIWDDPAMAPFRARMLGHPITRPERTTGLVPLSNVSWVWEDPIRNWGMMLGPMKILANDRDKQFHCFNLLTDPTELTDLGEPGCAPMPEIARRVFGSMPMTAPRMRDVLKRERQAGRAP